MALRIVWSYEEAGEGWSELYGTDQSDPSAYITLTPSGNLDPACPAFKFLLARVGCLNGASYVTHVRASLVGSPGIVLGVNIRSSDGHGTYVTNARRPTASSTEVFAKLELRILCGTTRRRTLWLGGIPESIISPPQFYSPTADWLEVLSAFRDELVIGTTSYGIIGRPRKTTVPAAVTISAFAVDASGYTATLTVPSTASFLASNSGLCIVRTVRRPRGWNGIHGVSVLDATHLEIGPLRLPGHTVPPFVLGDSGSVQVYAPSYLKYTAINTGRITKRKVGAPFGRPVGRGPTR